MIVKDLIEMLSIFPNHFKIKLKIQTTERTFSDAQNLTGELYCAEKEEITLMGTKNEK